MRPAKALTRLLNWHRFSRKILVFKKQRKTVRSSQEEVP